MVAKAEAARPSAGGRLRRLLEQQPGDPAALCELAELMVTLQDRDAAVSAWMQVVEADPKHAGAWSGLGELFERAGEPADAVACFRAAASSAPSAERHFRLGCALHASGELGAAADSYQAALALQSEFSPAWFNLGGILVAAGQAEQALLCYRRTVAADPAHARAWCNLGVLLRRQGNPAEAEEALTTAVKLRRGYALALANLAGVQETRNRVAAATCNADLALATAPGDGLASLVRARLHRRAGELEAAAERVEQAISGAADPELRGRALIEAGLIRDRLQDADGAFEAWSRGQALLAALPAAAAIDRDAWPAMVRGLRARTDELLALPAAAGEALDDGPPPIFMLGFPRSGTTLTEQILDSHPALAALEEGPWLDRAFAESGYPASAEGLDPAAIRARWRHQVAPRVPAGLRPVDKLPLNLVHAALLSRAFPDAKLVVNLRDPRDVCLSCFAQAFVLNEAMIHFTDLERTATLYAQVMGQWLELRDRLPVGSWFELRYEALVGDLEGTARRLSAFLDLPWDERVLRYHEHAAGRRILTPSHQDVQQPIFTRARGRWRRYADPLSAVQSTLAPFVEALGYAP